eukprot:362979-Chlamydomonas_euryale.AAC.7
MATRHAGLLGQWQGPRCIRAVLCVATAQEQVEPTEIAEQEQQSTAQRSKPSRTETAVPPLRPQRALSLLTGLETRQIISDPCDCTLRCTARAWDLRCVRSVAANTRGDAPWRTSRPHRARPRGCCSSQAAASTRCASGSRAPRATRRARCGAAAAGSYATGASAFPAGATFLKHAKRRAATSVCVILRHSSASLSADVARRRGREA